MLRLRFCTAALFIFGALILCGGVLQAQEDDEALQLYYSANALFNRKLYSMASEEYEAFLEAYPRHEKAPRARLGRALCLYSLDRKEQAAPLFAELSRDRTLENRQEIHTLWGQCLLALDKPDEAERAFAWSASNGNDSGQRVHARVGRIEALYRLSRWEDVIEEGDVFLRDERGSQHAERVTFQAAVARFELGRYAEARTFLESLYEPDEDSAFMQHIAFLLAECQRELGETGRAVELFDRAGRGMSGAFTGEALFRMGFIHFRQGDYDRAAAEFSDLLEDHAAGPNASLARLYLGRCHLEQKRFRRAERTFAEFDPDDGEYLEAQLWLARTLKRQEKWDQAGSTLEPALKAADDSPMRVELLFELADVQREQGRHQEAAQGFREIVSGFPHAVVSTEALRLEAYCLHKDGRYGESLKRCDTYLSRHPDSDRKADVAFMKAENLFLLDRLQESEPVYAGILAEHPDHFYADSARFRIAQIRYYQKRWQDALEASRPLAAPGADTGGAFFEQLDYVRGDCLFHLQQWNPAAESFERFAGDHPDANNRDAALFKAALAAQYAGRTEEAVAGLESFVSRYPQSEYAPHARVELGRLRYESGDLRKARRDLSRAAEEGNDPFALYYLGYVASADGDEEQALQHFSDLETRHPESDLAADAILQQAILHIRRGEFADGQDALERLLASREHSGRISESGKSDHVCFYLGIALARQKHWDRAAVRFREVYEQHPGSAFRDRALYEWAWCEKALDRKGRAAELYAEFVRSFPASSLASQVRFEAAELAYEDGRYDEAARGFRTLAAGDVSQSLRERSLYRMGWCCFSSGDMSAAAGWFEALLEEFPSSNDAAVARYQAGEARLKLKEYEQAYDHFRALADRRPPAGREDAAGDNAKMAEQALLRLGECAGLTQRWQESQNAYARFVKRYPGSAFIDEARFGMGWAQENREKYLEAIESYEAVLARGGRDETSARSQFQIGECYFALERYNDAVKALIKVEVMYAYPQWGSKALLEVGRALEIPGRTGEAIERYREVISKYPRSDAAVVAQRKLDNLSSG